MQPQEVFLAHISVYDRVADQPATLYFSTGSINPNQLPRYILIDDDRTDRHLIDDTTFERLLAEDRVPSDRYYMPRIKDPGNFEQYMFSDGMTSGVNTVAFGNLTLVNVDGVLDNLTSQYDFAGWPLYIYKVTLSDNETDATPQLWFRGTMDQAEASFQKGQPSLITVQIRDRWQEFAKPIQQNLYGGTNNGAIGIDGTLNDIAGQPKPLAYGTCFNVKGVPVNTSTLIYQVHDGAIKALTGVKDSGVPLALDTSAGTAGDFATSALLMNGVIAAGKYATCLNEGLFRLNTSPAGDVTCDLLGDNPANPLPDIEVVAPALTDPDLNGNENAVFSPDGTKLYVTAAFRINIFDTSTFAQIGQINGPFSGFEGMNISPDGTKLYVIQLDVPSLLYVINTATLLVTATITLGSFVGYDFKILPTGTTGYATSIGPNTVTVVNLLTNTVTTTIDVSNVVPGSHSNYGPRGMAISKDGTRLYVVASGGAADIPVIVVINTSTNTISDTIFVPGDPGFDGGQFLLDICLSGDEMKAYVADYTGYFMVVNLASKQVGKVRRMIPLSGNFTYPFTVTMAASADFVYYADWTSSTLFVFRQSDDALIQSINLGGPADEMGFAVVISKDGTKVAVVGGNKTALLTINAFVGNVAGIIRRIATDRGGMVDGVDLDSDSFAALNAIDHKAVGIFIDGNSNNTNIDGILSQLCDSIGAFAVFNNVGLLQVGKLAIPTGLTPTMTISTLDLIDLEKRVMADTDRGLPAWRVSVGYAKNYTVQNASGLALAASDAFVAFTGQEIRYTSISDTSIQRKNLLATEITRDTLLALPTDAAIIAQQLFDIYSVQRDRYFITVNAHGRVVNINDVVQLKFNRFGLTAGKNFIVLGKVEEAAQNRLQLDLWG